MKEYKVKKSEKEWKESLSPEQYKVLREQGTEHPNTGEYNLHTDKGSYCCAGCGQKLFESEMKFKSNCGWPSFDEAIDGSVEYKKDTSHGMIRTEVLCTNCGGHLGHVFEDGPTDSGERYCINSVSLNFNK